MSVPAHKVVGDEHKPGQLTFDRYPYLKHSTADQTLGDYLARKQRYAALDTVALEKVNKAAPGGAVKKLSFEEWVLSVDYELCNYQAWCDFEGSCYSMLEMAWKAAQENV